MQVQGARGGSAVAGLSAALVCSWVAGTSVRCSDVRGRVAVGRRVPVAIQKRKLAGAGASGLLIAWGY